MSYLTLDPPWTAPSSCLASTAYYYMVVRTYTAGIVFSEMFGAPTPLMMSADPTGPCIPPGFTTGAPYMTDGPCPTGYTEACATGALFSGTPASSVTCCPSGVFKFACHGETYGCLATADSGDVWTGTRTDIALTPNTQVPETHTAFAGESLWAWGIKFIRVGRQELEYQRWLDPTNHTGASTSFESTSPPRPTAAEPETVQSTSSQTSPGTTAGISVGAMAGAIMIALSAWLLYRKRQRRPAVQQHDPQYHHPPATYNPHQYYNAPPPYPQSKAELGTGGERHVPAELQ
ncbi:hypothetical protein PG994_014444 [Apiospora phragmitis]|uniref:Uncharacterized protein n=1 Tax=Apiospora phragmitis TaxID=2905665 RepID=A0ABR1T4S9_9PEZI